MGNRFMETETDEIMATESTEQVEEMMQTEMESPDAAVPELQESGELVEPEDVEEELVEETPEDLLDEEEEELPDEEEEDYEESSPSNRRKTMAEVFEDMTVDSSRKSLKKASKRKKRQLYGTETINTIGDEMRVKTPGQVKRDAFLRLMDSFRYKKVLTGRIIEVKKTPNLNMVTVKVMEGPYAVTIPAPYLVRLSKDEHQRMNGDDQEKFIKLLANQRVGREIDYIVTTIDEEQEQFIGNRVMAMDKIKAEKFMETKNGQYVIQEGDLAEARICYTTAAKVMIEVFGIEKLLKQSDISYTRIADVSKYFQHEDEHGGLVRDEFVTVRLKEIIREKYQDEGGIWRTRIDIRPSIKEGQEDPRDMYIRNIDVGGNVLAEVTVVDENGVFCKIEAMELDVKCSNPLDIKPVRGNKVLVTIRSIDYEKKFVNGIIISKIV